MSKQNNQLKTAKHKTSALQDEIVQSDIGVKMEGSSGVQLVGSSHLGSEHGPVTPFGARPDADIYLEATNPVRIELADPSYLQSEMVHDKISDEDHAHLVNKLASVPWTEGDDQDSRSETRLLLFQLLAWHYSKFDRKYSIKEHNSDQEAKTLFEANPWLASLIDTGWRDQSYRKICRLSQHFLRIFLSHCLSFSFHRGLASTPTKNFQRSGRRLDGSWLVPLL
jgi:hypothetical protein